LKKYLFKKIILSLVVKMNRRRGGRVDGRGSDGSLMARRGSLDGSKGSLVA
jgi:hypothetical protein